MAQLYLDSASINNLTVTSLYGTVGSATTAGINVANSAVSTQVTRLVFNNANNVTFGLNNNTLTAQFVPSLVTQSYYNSPDVFGGMLTTATANFNLGGQSQIVQPFVLDRVASLNFVRIPIQYTFSSTTWATTNSGTSYTMGQTQNFYANVYSLGTGTDAGVLKLITGGSFNMAVSINVSMPGGAGSTQHLVTYNMTYAVTGSTATTGANWASPGASISVLTTHLTAFSGNKYLDIPLGTVLNRGAYWMAFQKSTAIASAGVVSLSNLTHNNTNFIVTQINSRFAEMGGDSTIGTNNLKYGLKLGLGYYTTSNSGGTTNSISLSAANFSTAASHPMIPFQLAEV